MAYSYMLIIMFDFVFGPIFWGIIQFHGAFEMVTQWEPLTLRASGIFHATICSVLGISAFTRGKEKIESLRISKESE